jgi:hypothetical protein
MPCRSWSLTWSRLSIGLSTFTIEPCRDHAATRGQKGATSASAAAPIRSVSTPDRYRYQPSRAAALFGYRADPRRR